ncbi:MAG: transcriptional regulator NrdR [Candidatus Omnitrophica bacterium]|jgi:transcriptional repressor NrdR|nr:transcriptional regulator NrdR [Candidatus Omnitrophota bacterium]
MKCPFCGYKEDKVVDSRATQEESAIRRRRECLSCAKRFTTYEYIEELAIMVVKKDGRRQGFDRQKILSGIMRACEKRPVGVERMEEIVTWIERNIQKKFEREIPVTRIGEMVMEKLKEIDDVAYVRFASVYRQFKDVEQFMVELNDILKKEKKPIKKLKSKGR